VELGPFKKAHFFYQSGKCCCRPKWQSASKQGAIGQGCVLANFSEWGSNFPLWQLGGPSEEEQYGGNKYLDYFWERAKLLDYIQVVLALHDSQVAMVCPYSVLGNLRTLVATSKMW
jgi:hypothetical protein